MKIRITKAKYSKNWKVEFCGWTFIYTTHYYACQATKHILNCLRWGCVVSASADGYRPFTIPTLGLVGVNPPGTCLNH